MSDAINQVSYAEMLQRSPQELATVAAERREELRKLRFKHAMSQLPKTHTLRLLRREVARLLTAARAQAMTAGKVT